VIIIYIRDNNRISGVMVSMIGSSETDLSSNHDRNELKVEKDTMGKNKLVNEFF
jgi:hypothetical protein